MCGAVVLALVLGACTGGGAGKKTGGAPTNSGRPVRATVHWDLRHGHSARDVQWRGPDSFEVGGGVQTKLELPGRTFQDRVDRFGADKQGGQVADVVVFYPGSSISAAYTRARRLAEEWKCDTRPLDAWYANLKGHPTVSGDLPAVLSESIGHKPTGPGGPIPSIEIPYSFDDANPAMVKLEFFWR